MHFAVALSLACLLTASAARHLNPQATINNRQVFAPSVTAPEQPTDPTPVTTAPTTSAPSASVTPLVAPPYTPEYFITPGGGAGCAATLSIALKPEQVGADCSNLKSTFASTATKTLSVDCGGCKSLVQAPNRHGCPMLPADKTKVDAATTVLAWACAVATSG